MNDVEKLPMPSHPTTYLSLAMSKVRFAYDSNCFEDAVAEAKT